MPIDEQPVDPGRNGSDATTPGLLGGAIGVLDDAIVARRSEASGKRLRVLHVINGEHYAGAERVQDLLALRLPDEGYDVGFACLKPGRFAAARRSQAAPLHVLPMQSRLDLRPVLALAHIVKQGGYSVIHTHTSRSALLGSLAAKMSRVALVHHIHSAATPDTLRDLRDGISAAVERFGFRRADAVIAVSPGIAAYARRGGVRGDRLTIVPNGVPAVDRLTDKLPPAGPWTVGTVALFRERKGLEVLLEAAARPCAGTATATAHRGPLRDQRIRSACATWPTSWALPARSIGVAFAKIFPPSWLPWTCLSCPACCARDCRW